MVKFLACVVALLCAADLSEDEAKRVAEYRRGQIAAANADMAATQSEIKAALKANDRIKAEQLKGKVRSLRERAADLRRAPDEELWVVMRNAERATQAAEFERQQEQERKREIAAAGPVSITRMGIVTNVIGLPEIVLEVQNNTDEVIEAFEFEADCFSKFDEPVNRPGGANRYCGQYKHAMRPRSRERVTAQLSLQSNTAKADIWISRVKLSSGEVWAQTKDKAGKTPYGLAKARLVD